MGDHRGQPQCGPPACSSPETPRERPGTAQLHAHHHCCQAVTHAYATGTEVQGRPLWVRQVGMGCRSRERTHRRGRRDRHSTGLASSPQGSVCRDESTAPSCLTPASGRGSAAGTPFRRASCRTQAPAPLPGASGDAPCGAEGGWKAGLHRLHGGVRSRFLLRGRVLVACSSEAVSASGGGHQCLAGLCERGGGDDEGCGARSGVGTGHVLMASLAATSDTA